MKELKDFQTYLEVNHIKTLKMSQEEFVVIPSEENQEEDKDRIISMLQSTIGPNTSETLQNKAGVQVKVFNFLVHANPLNNVVVANSTLAVPLSREHFDMLKGNSEDCDLQNFIFSNPTEPNDPNLMICSCIIDHGYILNMLSDNYDTFIYVFNKSVSEDLRLDTFNVKVTAQYALGPKAKTEKFIEEIKAVNNTCLTLFSQVGSERPEAPIDSPRIVDVITNLSINNYGDNGIDVQLAKDYVINGKGYLNLFLPTHMSRDNKDRPHTFVMRSRFAKLGISIHEKPSADHVLELELFNNNMNTIVLGNRFFSVFLKPPFNFDFINTTIISALFTPETKNISTTVKNKKKAQKIA